MDTPFILILIRSVWLFAIIFFSVRLAIKPLLKKPEKEMKEEEDQDFGLVKLRDIEVLSNDELEEAIKLLQNKGTRKKEKTDNEQYQKYAGILNRLKEMGYFTVEQYLSKIDKLKDYYKVD